MESSTKDQLDALTKEVRRMRAVFGLSIAAIAIMLMIVLPSTIRNSVFRVHNQPETKGLLSSIVELISGEPVSPGETGMNDGLLPPEEAEGQAMP